MSYFNCRIHLEHFSGFQDDYDLRRKEIQRKLYKAPEFLSQDKESHQWGSQKGDIYSFGILLYEIVGRAGPWGRMNALDNGNTVLNICLEHKFTFHHYF